MSKENEEALVTAAGDGGPVGDDQKLASSIVRIDSPEQSNRQAPHRADADCENCGVVFRPVRFEQRFCSAACRKAFHNGNRQASHETSHEASHVLETHEATAEEGEGHDFDWYDTDDVVAVPHQSAIAVYVNPRNVIVIRQQGACERCDEDQLIFVQPESVGPLIAALQRLAREGA